MQAIILNVLNSIKITTICERTSEYLGQFQAKPAHLELL